MHSFTYKARMKNNAVALFTSSKHHLITPAGHLACAHPVANRVGIFAPPLPRIYGRETRDHHDEGSPTLPKETDMKSRQLITAFVAAATLGMSTAGFARDDDDVGVGRPDLGRRRLEVRRVEPR